MIRRATKEDIVSLMVLSEQFFQESNYEGEFGATFDPESYLYFLVQTMSSPHGFVCVSEDKETIIGFFVGILTQMNFNRNQWMANEVYLYMEPEKRNGLESRRMIKAFEDWATENKVKAIEIGCVRTLNMEKTSNFYKRIGFNVFSHSHLKKVG